jgi:hypothetical protein
MNRRVGNWDGTT